MRTSTTQETLRSIHIKNEKVTDARYECGIKRCLTMKINQFIFVQISSEILSNLVSKGGLSKEQ